jgi:hypothetical protein
MPMALKTAGRISTRADGILRYLSCSQEYDNLYGRSYVNKCPRLIPAFFLAFPLRQGMLVWVSGQ